MTTQDGKTGLQGLSMPEPSPRPDFPSPSPCMQPMLSGSWAQKVTGMPPLAFEKGLPSTNIMSKIPTSKEACNHHCLTRIWTSQYHCDRCDRIPPWGWLFRCVDDTELQLRQGLRNGRKYLLGDAIHQKFLPLVVPTKNGPEARSATAKLFQDVVSPEQPSTYTHSQWRKIIQQRQLVLKTSRDQAQKLQGSSFDPEMPWAPRIDATCGHKVCVRCLTHPERTYESLNAVCNNEFTLTSIVGFGFWEWGSRLVTDARLVRNLGARPVPVEKSSPLPPCKTAASSDYGPSATLNGGEEWIRSHCHARSKRQSLCNPNDMYPRKHGKGFVRPPPGLPILSLNEREFFKALLIPLPPQDAAERFFLESTVMMQEEHKSGIFHEEPLSVLGGLALTEESLEECIPDIIVTGPDGESSHIQESPCALGSNIPPTQKPSSEAHLWPLWKSRDLEWETICLAQTRQKDQGARARARASVRSKISTTLHDPPYYNGKVEGGLTASLDYRGPGENRKRTNGGPRDSQITCARSCTESGHDGRALHRGWPWANSFPAVF